MTAYIIFTRERTIDENELEVYRPKARASMEGRPVTKLVAYGKQEMLEGKPVEGVVVLSFPSFEEAKDWYHSKAYQDACAHRFKGAEYRVVIVEGA
ncbi:DUF1330 domain-containing protein [Parvibaculum sp.]|uniref:DUF1330 domain-containing protein n=1 Tax=Parvibaculum sp. TaxID=2024848 RepID=UPI0027319D7A|nr:DUF1330 domain-containing protein [Parvibaculum sp.]MDP1627384.1 DUF1330 domain-containing protein [Parvibaculum sp.]MDP2148563.1 DUF1330 domain-containing protein [Parvibaculum sp.]MDP3327520.1 DUF1330 domain-containing protein [Parvibaculum sp.]